MSNAKDKLDDLAQIILDEVTEPDVKLATRLDAMKVLTNYFVGMQKVKNKSDDDDEDEPVISFSELQKRVAENK